MASINKVILIGNLGNDPEIRYLPSGDALANLSLATTDKWKDKDGQKQEKTEWHRIVAFGKLAEIIGEYLKKGSSVYIEGKLQTRKYEKDGVERYSTEIVASEMKMLGGRVAGTDSPPAQAKTGTPPSNKQAKTGGHFDDLEDDIPF